MTLEKKMLQSITHSSTAVKRRETSNLTRRDFLHRGFRVACAGVVLPCMTLAEDERFATIGKMAQAEIVAGHCFGVAYARADRDLFGFAGWQGATAETGAVDGQTRFELASVTKTVTAAVAGRLVAQGLLDPQAPFTDYFTDHVLASSNHGIRVLDLATHTSGLPWFSSRRLTPDKRVHGGWKGFIEELRTCRPDHPRGTVRYNCINFCILAEICSRVAGKPIDALAREMVFAPLGMTHCAWWPQPNDGHLAHLPLQHFDKRERAVGTVSDPPAFYAGRPTGNAGLYANIVDMARFVRDLVERRVFEKGYYDLVFKTLAEGNGQRRTFGWNRTADGIPTGLSKNTIYHTGYTGQTLCVDPDKGFAGVVLTNRCTNDARAATRGRARLLSSML